MLQQAIAWVCLLWYIALQCFAQIGVVQLYRYYRKPRSRAVIESRSLPEVPHITIIRPTKGLEPYLYECLAATFYQSYPREKITIFFCVSSRADLAVPIIEQLLNDFPNFDARLLIEDEDEFLRSNAGALGPNPKIRNMSRAYREAKGDFVWIIDCNVWVAKGTAGRLVDTIEGIGNQGLGRKQKFVHQLPLVVDVTNERDQSNLEHAVGPSHVQTRSTSTMATSLLQPQDKANLSASRMAATVYGGRLEEAFMSSSHAKFYTAINTVLVAPCIVGKSNMFRRSHLDALTQDSPDFRPSGIDYFSYNICEDHLIGDLLWKRHVPEEADLRAKFGRHAMVFGDVVIQPMANMSAQEYIARRVRWLRVRKFTVTAATFVEPSTESFLCSLYGAYAITTIPWFRETLGIPPSWTSFLLFWIASVALWSLVDWSLYGMLQSMASVDVDENTPTFAAHSLGNCRSYGKWLVAWLGREALALPIWLWAVFGGVTVTWRGKKYWVGIDMRVHAIDGPTDAQHHASNMPGLNRSAAHTPDRMKSRRE